GWLRAPGALPPRRDAHHTYCPPLFFHHPPPPEICTLSLHDALPISNASVASETDSSGTVDLLVGWCWSVCPDAGARGRGAVGERSEEHTSELQSRENLVCRLLLEKKKDPL